MLSVLMLNVVILSAVTLIVKAPSLPPWRSTLLATLTNIRLGNAS